MCYFCSILKPADFTQTHFQFFLKKGKKVEREGRRKRGRGKGGKEKNIGHLKAHGPAWQQSAGTAAWLLTRVLHTFPEASEFANPFPVNDNLQSLAHGSSGGAEASVTSTWSGESAKASQRQRARASAWPVETVKSQAPLKPRGFSLPPQLGFRSLYLKPPHTLRYRQSKAPESAGSPAGNRGHVTSTSGL